MKKLFIICFCFMFQFAIVSSSHAGWFDDVIDWVDGAANDTADWFETAYDDVTKAVVLIGAIGENVFIGLYNDTQKLLGVYDDGTDAEYLASWQVKAVTLQTRLDKYAPINKATMPLAHNAFNSAAYTTTLSYLDPNQEMSMLNQLNVGIRALELDAHWYDGDVILCHNGGQGICSPEDRSFAQGLEEIRYWFQVEDHKVNDVIIINLEDRLDGHYDEAAIVIEAVIGYLVYQPETPCDSFQDMAAVTSKADVLADGKNIIIINSNSSSCTQNGYGDYVYTGNWKTADYTNLTPYPDCTFGTNSPSDIQSGFWRAYNDGTAIGDYIESRDMSVEQVETMVKCGINAPGPEPLEWWDARHEAQIWSWAVDEPNDAGGNEDCAEQGGDGRFNDIPCTGYPRNYACQHPENRDWQITAASGVWADGENACDDEYGDEGYVFSVPANGYENAQLADAKNAVNVSKVWLNYSDLAVEGDWRPADWQPAYWSANPIISLLGAHGKYVVAEDNGGGDVNADRSAIGSWEKFTLANSDSYTECIRNNDSVQIRTGNGYYFSAQTNGDLDADRTSGRSWETFTLINHTDSDGCLENGDIISLRSAHGKYVVAESNGDANADRGAIGSWERFTVVVDE